MTSRELNILLIKQMPELKEKYDEEVSWQEGDDTGSHVVFEDVLFPYLIESAKQNNEVQLKKCFEVIESILNQNDEYANEVVALSVIEDLANQDDVTMDFSGYMKSKTLQMFRLFSV